MDYDDRFEVIRELGEGGMGVVYLCHDAVLEREVALKLLKGAAMGGRSRFLREARALARLTIDGVVRVFDLGVYQGCPCLVLEYISGDSLGDLVLREGPLLPNHAAELMAQICSSVAEVHEAGIWHRDLKPDNVLLRKGRPVLVDFGLCDPDQLLANLNDASGLGSLGYVPPEQLCDARNADALSDVYSLGATLYALITGSAPFPREATREAARAVLKGQFKIPSALRPGLPTELDQICLRALQVDPRDRYPSATALADDLRAFLLGKPLAPIEERAESEARTQVLNMLVDSDFDEEPDDPDLPRSPTELGIEGDGHLQAGEFAAAVESYERALEARPDTDTRLKLADALRRSGLAKRAIQVYGDVLKEWPEDFRVHVGRGAARAKLKDYAGAAVDFRHALEACPAGSPWADQIEEALDAASKRVGQTVVGGEH